MNTIDSTVQTFSRSIELQSISLSGTTCIATRFQVGSRLNMQAFKIQINVITPSEVELKTLVYSKLRQGKNVHLTTKTKTIFSVDHTEHTLFKREVQK